jgi:virulence-associated protein VagC
MGLLDSQNQNQYYSEGDYGGYQFITLDNIISAFMISYVGESKLITKVNRTDVQFHAMRAIQELSYDVFRSVKSQEIEIPPSLKMILPQDYINYVKLVRVDSNGIERILYPMGKTSNPFAIEQDADGVYQYNDTVEPFGEEDTLSEQVPSNTWNTYQDQTDTDVYADDTSDLDVDLHGRRYGLDPQYSQSNGTFFIDYDRGYIHFGSTLVGETIILKYISDGLGTDDEMVVHKFAEEAVYKWIAYGVLSTRSNIPEYVVQRFKKEKFAETRKAKIRLSNIKMEEFTQVLKGMGKQIK